MPLYTFKNKNDGSVSEVEMKISELDQFKEDNPELETVIGVSNLIAGQSLNGGKLPEGFKDRLRLLKQKHPKGRGVDHLI